MSPLRERKGFVACRIAKQFGIETPNWPPEAQSARTGAGSVFVHSIVSQRGTYDLTYRCDGQWPPSQPTSRKDFADSLEETRYYLILAGDLECGSTEQLVT